MRPKCWDTSQWNSIFERLGTIQHCPFPETMLIFLFLRLHRSQQRHKIDLRGGSITELALDTNEIEQEIEFRKASFSFSVSTTSVNHCRHSCLWRQLSSLIVLFEEVLLSSKTNRHCVTEKGFTSSELFTLIFWHLSSDLVK